MIADKFSLRPSRCSLLNHSCTPNCVAMFDGTLLHIRALENIKCGDEVCFVAYLTRKYFLLRPETSSQKGLTALHLKSKKKKTPKLVEISIFLSFTNPKHSKKPHAVATGHTNGTDTI